MKNSEKAKEDLFNQLVELCGKIAQTGQQDSENELAEKGKKSSQNMQGLKDTIIWLSSDGIVEYASSEVKITYDYDPHELVGKHISEITPPDEASKILDAVKHIFGGARGCHCELWQIDRKGNVFCIEATFSPIKKNDRVVATQVAMRDMAEWSQTRERFKRTLNFLNNILQSSSSISILSTDNDRNIDYWNSGAEKLFGYKAEEVVGRQKIDILYVPDHEDTRKAVEEARIAIIEKKQSTTCDVVEKAKGGRKLWVRLSLSPRIDEDGNVVGILGIGQDITEKKRAQEELKRSEERFRSIFHQSPIGIALFEQSGKMVERNKAFSRMFPLREGNQGKTAKQQLSSYVDIFENELKNLRKGKEIQCESEFNANTVSGKKPERGKPGTRYLYWHMTTLDGGKDLDSSLILAQVQDITERKLAEEAKLRKAREEMKKANRLVEGLKKEIMQSVRFHKMISRSSKMNEIFGILPEIAETTASVMIGGESGTGKELIARSLHEMGPRKEKPFVAINCGALPDNLLEAELFGYKAGAFTDARKDKPGKFTAAEGGSIFFDEIGEISQAMQVKLLRVLQERTYEPLGSVMPVKTDVRVITASNRNIEDMVKKGLFRKDLFYRINVVNIDLPPLRERICDIPLLCDYFISNFNARYRKDIKGISEEVLDNLLAYNFPGNIRELENIIEHAFILCKGDFLQAEHLSNKIQPESVDKGIANNITALKNFKDVERFYIESMLTETSGDKLLAAKRMGIHKATLYRKMKQLDVIDERKMVV